MSLNSIIHNRLTWYKFCNKIFKKYLIVTYKTGRYKAIYRKGVPVSPLILAAIEIRERGKVIFFAEWDRSYASQIIKGV